MFRRACRPPTGHGSCNLPEEHSARHLPVHCLLPPRAMPPATVVHPVGLGTDVLIFNGLNTSSGASRREIGTIAETTSSLPTNRSSSICQWRPFGSNYRYAAFFSQSSFSHSHKPFRPQKSRKIILPIGKFLQLDIAIGFRPLMVAFAHGAVSPIGLDLFPATFHTPDCATADAFLYLINALVSTASRDLRIHS